MLLPPAPDLIGERPFLEAGVILESIDQELFLPLVQLQRRAPTYLHLQLCCNHCTIYEIGGYPAKERGGAVCLSEHPPLCLTGNLLRLLLTLKARRRGMYRTTSRGRSMTRASTSDSSQSSHNRVESLVEPHWARVYT